MVRAAPSAVVIESAGNETDLRKQLRTKNAVSELGASRVPFSQAPTGTYGFIAPQPLGMALVTQSPDLLLERTPPSPNAYEIHKLADGSGMVVSYEPEAAFTNLVRNGATHEDILFVKLSHLFAL